MKKEKPEIPKNNLYFSNVTPTSVLIAILFLIVGSAVVVQAYSNPFIDHVLPIPSSPIPSVIPSQTEKPIIKPFPTSTTEIKDITFPSVKPLPTITPTPITAPSISDRVNCLYDSKCGGKKETTELECNTTLCCPINGEYKIASINDCYEEQNKLLKEAYAKSISENIKNIQNDQVSQEEAYLNTLETNTASYNSCVAEVQAWYGKQQNIWSVRGTIDSYGAGSFQEQVEIPYKSYLSRCETIYQPRN